MAIDACVPAGLVRLQQSDLDQAGGTITLEGSTPSRTINITSGALPSSCCGVPSQWQHRPHSYLHVAEASIANHARLTPHVCDTASPK